MFGLNVFGGVANIKRVASRVMIDTLYSYCRSCTQSDFALILLRRKHRHDSAITRSLGRVHQSLS